MVGCDKRQDRCKLVHADSDDRYIVDIRRSEVLANRNAADSTLSRRGVFKDDPIFMQGFCALASGEQCYVKTSLPEICGVDASNHARSINQEF